MLSVFCIDLFSVEEELLGFFVFVRVWFFFVLFGFLIGLWFA